MQIPMNILRYVQNNLPTWQYPSHRPAWPCDVLLLLHFPATNTYGVRIGRYSDALGFYLVPDTFDGEIQMLDTRRQPGKWCYLVLWSSYLISMETLYPDGESHGSTINPFKAITLDTNPKSDHAPDID